VPDAFAAVAPFLLAAAAVASEALAVAPVAVCLQRPGQRERVCLHRPGSSNRGRPGEALGRRAQAGQALGQRQAGQALGRRRPLPLALPLGARTLPLGARPLPLALPLPLGARPLGA
jgi:hypothetical protein